MAFWFTKHERGSWGSEKELWPWSLSIWFCAVHYNYIPHLYSTPLAVFEVNHLRNRAVTPGALIVKREAICMLKAYRSYFYFPLVNSFKFNSILSLGQK